MAKNSNSDTDGVTWGTASLPLGTTGLDLRTPGEPGTLTKLRNARFLDQKTLSRREGHRGQIVQSGGDFVTGQRSGQWVYGHGERVTISDNLGYTGAEHPIQTRGGGTFKFEGSDVVWTGDRLLVVKADGPFQGGSTFWGEDSGIPAFLPVQTDTLLHEVVTGYYVDMGLTEAEQIVAASTAAGEIALIVLDRETNQVVNRTAILGGASDPKHVRVVISSGIPLVFYIDDGTLGVVAWDGVSWSTPNSVDTEVDAFDTAVVSGSCHVVYRIDDELFITRFSGSNPVETPYASQSALDVFGTVPNGAVACAVDPVGNIGVVWAAADGLYRAVVTNSLAAVSSSQCSSDTDPWNRGLTAVFDGLSQSNGEYILYIVAGQESAPVRIIARGALLTRYNAEVVSKAFLVGNQPFVWLMATNSSTSYLAALRYVTEGDGGVLGDNVCGYADREETLPREASTGVAALASVSVDPRYDGTKLVWIRTYEVGDYARPNNARIGYVNFLPELSTANFGKSVYIAGSNCRNWDGHELGDAGFHDYPVASNEFVASEDSGLTVTDGLGDESETGYRYRIYAVRYNAMGERFQGIAITSPIIQVTLVLSEIPAIQLSIKTIPCTNHDDVVFEIYRTAAGGSVYYLEGIVDNDRDVGAVTFLSLMGDVELATKIPDPHAVTVGGLSELEESAPLGCATLITASDRLWGIGGQVPAGVAQYSKLYEQGEGAGFDALAGTQVVDATGGEITSISSFGDARVVAFQEKQLFVLTGDGPNNFSGDTGTFGVPQVVVADGALNHTGTLVLPIGLAFWGAGGPKILGADFKVVSISEPVETLAAEMNPSGARVDLARREVVWYTREGRALLWNYASGSRWAEWSGLPVAGCSDRRLVTTDGRLLTPGADEDQDDGRRFALEFATGNIRPDQLLTGGMRVRRVGFSGKYNGAHKVKFKVYYNGSPLWSEMYKWEPATSTWLSAAGDFEELLPAEVDALSMDDHSGAYSTSRRVIRETCRYFRVEVSDCGDNGFTPWELSFEIGVLPGMGRTAVNTFTE